ncbi:MAG: 50S ribosomal protein L18 [Candidatus Neomarinimicrobiota bacterium]|jgi:large subunit ribosomal protein L18|nr:50S ribosomal protein L18 [Candidatus Neomarinimicrobiota bacterium]|tara:strand:+ start:1848 stop:2219 length:372 start_codon:yes stop_codon:yes gene_type:complete
MEKLSIKETRNLRRRNRSKRNNLYHQERPRLVVNRSNKHIRAQIIDDHRGQTLVSASSNDKSMIKDISKAKNKTEISAKIGTVIAEKAIKNKIKKVVFDRNGYPYHGRIKAVADAAREAGLEF